MHLSALKDKFVSKKCRTINEALIKNDSFQDDDLSTLPSNHQKGVGMKM